MWLEVECAKQEKRHELVLSGKEVSARIDELEGALDPHVYTLTQVNFLEVSRTSLCILSDSIAQLTNLVQLVVHTNHLVALPSSLGHLTKLKLFDASNNLLQSIPEEIGNMKSLQALNLNGNKLVSLPSLLGMGNLSILNVSGNTLEEFPQVPSHLTELHLEKNSISSIPPNCITDLTALKILDLAENHITALPGELADCNKLKELNLKGNKMKDKRLGKLVSGGGSSKQILDYVRSHCPREKEESTSDSKKSAKGKKGKQENKHSQSHNSDLDAVMDSLNRLEILHSAEKESLVIALTPEVLDVRPHIICCIIRNLDFSGTKLKQFLALQTRLHETLGDRRNVATIATHDVEKIPSEGPLRYEARPPSAIAIEPLNRPGPGPVPARELFLQLQREADALRKEKKRNTYSGIHRYLHLLEGKPLWPCLVDCHDRVLSFHPITNSHLTKISEETTNVLVEVTSSSSQPICRKIADTLILESLLMGLGKVEDQGSKQVLVVEQVRVLNPDGNLKFVYPSKVDCLYEHPDVRVLRKY